MSSGRGSGNHGRRRRPVVHEEEHENTERWAVSYADMMTVLVGLFIVLYAISQVDQAKFEELRQSLAAGFGTTAPAVVMVGGDGALAGAEDVPIVPDLAASTGIDQQAITTGDVDTVSEEERNLRAAVAEYHRLDAIARQIAEALDTQHLGDRVRFRITDRGLIVGMVADDVFFSAGSADLTEIATRVIDTVAPVLVRLPDEISVEGHANILPISGRYPTNWELSTDRATQVLRRLVEFGGLPGQRIGATGFGDTRPLEGTSGAEALEVNRRVDLVILSGVPENVRTLLPSVAAADQG